MLTPQGDRLLAVIGRSPSRQGILEVADMPAALAALAAAVTAEEAVSAAHADTGRAAESALRAPAASRVEPGSAAGDAVSLRQRAFPLQSMIQRCLAAEKPIVWGV